MDDIQHASPESIEAQTKVSLAKALVAVRAMGWPEYTPEEPEVEDATPLALDLTTFAIYLRDFIVKDQRVFLSDDAIAQAALEYTKE